MIATKGESIVQIPIDRSMIAEPSFLPLFLGLHLVLQFTATDRSKSHERASSDHDDEVDDDDPPTDGTDAPVACLTWINVG